MLQADQPTAEQNRAALEEDEQVKAPISSLDPPGNFTNAPWVVLAPGIFIFLTTLAIFLIGDGLREALDPWVKSE